MKILYYLKFIIIISFIFVFIFISCDNNNKYSENSKFIIELPETSLRHKPDIVYEITKKSSDELMLDRLWNGTDSFELRLWIKVEVTNGGHVYIIKKINNKWQCLHYFFIENYGGWIDYNNIKKYIQNKTIDTFWVKKIQPKTNWDNFFKLIEKENIYNLPSQDDINGWKNIVEDGITYKIEIGTKYKYKFYYYNCPDIYEKEFKECRQMTNILDIFDKEFGLNFRMYGSYKCGNY